MADQTLVSVKKARYRGKSGFLVYSRRVKAPWGVSIFVDDEPTARAIQKDYKETGGKNVGKILLKKAC